MISKPRPPSAPAHLDIRVHGRVQGVCFRAAAHRIATEMQIGGWVRNEDDGSVFIEAEGAPADLEKFVAWCRRGPSAAVVQSVQTVESPVQGYSTFEISY